MAKFSTQLFPSRKAAPSTRLAPPFDRAADARRGPLPLKPADHAVTPLPGGSVLKVTGWFDNSAQNPANPDPAATVRWGSQTSDEMMIGYVEYYRVK